MEWCTAFTIHLNNLGIPIHGVSGEGPSARIDYLPEASPAQVDAAELEKQTFQIPLPPNLSSFKLGVFTSPDVSPLAKVMIPLTFSQLEVNINSPILLQQYWSALRQIPDKFGTDPSTITAIESLAKQYNIPIV